MFIISSYDAFNDSQGRLTAENSVMNMDMIILFAAETTVLFDLSREVISPHTDYLEPISYSIQKEHLDGPMFEAR
jgi:hypothetical protein